MSLYDRNNITNNLIINGDFDVWQRGTSFAGATFGSISADRWQYYPSTGVVTISRSTDVPTVAQSGHLSNYSVLIDCTTVGTSNSGDFVSFREMIEGNLWKYIAQQPFTLSFWVKATKTGTFCVALRNAGGDRTFICPYIVNTTATWEKKIFQIPASPSSGTWDYTTGIGLIVDFFLIGGSTFYGTAGSWLTTGGLVTSAQVNGLDSTANDFRLAQVQIEPGSIANPFSYRPIGQELELCYRYYQRYDSSTASNIARATGQLYATTAARIQLPLITEMRVAPSLTISGTVTFDVIGTGSTVYTGAGAKILNTKTVHFDVTGGTARTVGQMAVAISPTVIEIGADL